MRKLIVISMITLDGVMQKMGDSKENTSADFKYSEWTTTYCEKIGGKIDDIKKLKQ